MVRTLIGKKVVLDPLSIAGPTTYLVVRLSILGTSTLPNISTHHYRHTLSNIYPHVHAQQGVK